MCPTALTRLYRYAFGCSELLINPLHKWPHRGPFTRLFRSYLAARGTPLATKMSVIAYLSTCIGALLCLCVAVQEGGCQSSSLHAERCAAYQHEQRFLSLRLLGPTKPSCKGA